MALTDEVVKLVSRFGRYGPRRITAFLQASWLAREPQACGEDMASGRAEGTCQAAKRKRLWLDHGSCVRLRLERPDHAWAHDFVQTRTRDGRGVRLLTVMDE